MTHDQSEALAAADNILLLQDGRIVQQGGPQEIYSNPNSFYSADFLGANNIVKAKVKMVDGKNATIGGDNWDLAGTVRKPSGLGAAPGRACGDPRRADQRHGPAGCRRDRNESR
ncbi:hypothetical protein [Sinorhizobium psoraleae]|uniref:Uncharacterized protein n=1 Tax=Sinorhizobium psoraleae TaxID=520838 RepID=A0ABT4KCW6_9HYPH|nr:hypothetical protein [Sinorhizobium psoraleae]MCZ4088827.1 hypothetical protein [Sinorhizobium psoraleae]